jgi:ribosomal protein S18 acetylase RimI-like enzyme
MRIRTFTSNDTDTVVQLWRECGLVAPQNDPHKDIARKIAAQPELFLVGEQDGKVVATVMAGYDGHRGWLNYLAVSPDLRRQGLGREIVTAAQERLAALGCPKVNLQVRRSNAAVMGFYRALGFVEDDVVGMGKRLVRD